LRLDELPQTDRQISSGGQRLGVPASDQLRMLRQVLGQVNHEQRLAGGAPVHRRRRRLDRFGRQAAGDIGPHRRRIQAGQRQLPALVMRLQFLLERLERMFPHDQLHRPIGADHQQPRRFGPAGQNRQRLDAGMIAPVQILQHQYQRLLGAEHFERVGQFALVMAGGGGGGRVG
jgi:hypothetical protein